MPSLSSYPLSSPGTVASLLLSLSSMSCQIRFTVTAATSLYSTGDAGALYSTSVGALSSDTTACLMRIAAPSTARGPWDSMRLHLKWIWPPVQEDKPAPQLSSPLRPFGLYARLVDLIDGYEAGRRRRTTESAQLAGMGVAPEFHGSWAAGSDHCFCERTEGEFGSFSPSSCACILMRLDPLFGRIFLYSHILLLSVSNSIS